MAFSASSFFAGVGTVVVMLGVGFGGGLMMTGVLDEPRAPNKLERRAAEATVPSPAVESTQAPVIAAQPATQGKIEQIEDKTEPAAVAAAPAVAQTLPPPQSQPAAPASAAASPPPPVQPLAQAAAPAPSEDAQARVQEADLKKAQEADAKKLAERRKAQRIRQAERRRQREQALEDATEWVRNLPPENAPPRYYVAN